MDFKYSVAERARHGRGSAPSKTAAISRRNAGSERIKKEKEANGLQKIDTGAIHGEGEEG